MKSINVRFRFKPAKNGQHVSVHNLIFMVYTPEKAEQFGLTKVYTPYRELFRTEDECHKLNLRFADTTVLAELDGKQDKLQNYLVKSTAAAREVPIEAVSAAAIRVYYAMGPYLEAASKEYNINATEIRKLVLLLKSEPLAADIATLGMTAVVDELEQVNNEFTRVYLQRTGELNARQTAEKMVSIRPKVDDAAKLNFLMINSRYNVAYLDDDQEQMAAIGELMDAINGILAQFQLVIGTASSSEAESDEELPEAGDGADGPDGADEPTPTPDDGGSEGGTPSEGETPSEGGTPEGGDTTPPTTGGNDNDEEVVG